MSLRIKHEQALKDKEYIKDKVINIKAKIKLDKSGAFWHIDETLDYMDSQVKEATEQPFSGISVGVKDLFCVKGMTTTAGSKILADFVSPYTSTVWKRLEEKGAFLSGKLAMDEFAMGSFTNTSYLGKTSIPGYPEHTAGGSSGGSAAAVAAGIVDFSIGSDTGGSVRLPASFCSIVGYKPSYGAFSRFGMIPYASSLDQAGFFTQTLDDLKYILEQNIADKDPSDMTCVGLGDYVESDAEIKTVGYFRDILESKDVQSSVKEAYKNTLVKLEASGIKLVPVEVDFMHQAAEIYYIIACSEASSNLARYQGVYFGKKLIDEPKYETFSDTLAHARSKYFGDEVQRRIMLGSFILSAENFSSMYEKAWDMRRALTKSLDDILNTVDSIVLPVSPTVAPKWEEISQMTTAQIYLSDYMTVPFSLAGVPAVSLPWYKDENGLGIGMQWVGKKLSDYQFIDSLIKLEKELFKD